jgi:capsule polysaccharide export protein KpsC/LpsZ
MGISSFKEKTIEQAKTIIEIICTFVVSKFNTKDDSIFTTSNRSTRHR